jgi:hypothetical protein
VRETGEFYLEVLGRRTVLANNGGARQAVAG